MREKPGSKEDPPDLNPALRSWIDNVIVPALVDRFIAELSERGHSASVLTAKAQETDRPKAQEKGPHRVHKSPEMLTVAEAAERLGLRQSTLRAWILRRRITYVKMGGAVRIPASAVQELTEKGTVPELKPRKTLP